MKNAFGGRQVKLLRDQEVHAGAGEGEAGGGKTSRDPSGFAFRMTTME
jgi:hypothetical protein